MRGRLHPSFLRSSLFYYYSNLHQIIGNGVRFDDVSLSTVREACCVLLGLISAGWIHLVHFLYTNLSSKIRVEKSIAEGGKVKDTLTFLDFDLKIILSLCQTVSG